MAYNWTEIKDDFGEIWNPELNNAPKSIEGELIEARSGVGPNNSSLYTLKQGDGSYISLWGNSVLNGRFRKINVGMMCRIDYRGRATGKGGREYKNFSVHTAKS